jgi:phosphate transport system substrate-binding protein
MRKILFVMLAALSSAFGSCADRSPMPRSIGGTHRLYGNAINIKGSDTMVLLAQYWAENYLQLHPHLVIQVNGGGSGTGLAALINGTTDISQTSRSIKEQERADFRAKYHRDVVEVRVSLDGLGVYVNMANPLSDLSLSQVRDIYTGRISDWEEIGGVRGRVILYSRENNSGTYEYFREHVLEKADFATRTQTLPGNAAVINAVSQDKRGIGYGGIAYAKGVKVLAIRKDARSPAIAPDLAHVTSGAYPISRFLYWYLPSEPTGEVKNLVDWVQSEGGQSLAKEVGFFPIRTK